MKRFVLAAALAVAALGLTGSAADAQYFYNYYGVNPYTGGIYNNRAVITPFAAQGYYNYYNPWTGATGGRALYQNAWGTNLYRSGGFNPYFGRGYSSGYYYPGFGVSPLYGSFYRYRW